jgi:tRNA U34 5-carboxymethylaminomethyl modifying GTPase MnmE/TrmE
MTRQGPSESATIFPVGMIKRGNDGNNWIVIQTKTSKRWSKVNESKLQKTSKASKASNKTKKYTIKKSKKNDISVDKLKQLLKKYNVTTSGSKEKMAQGLVRVRNFLIESKDLELIYNLLDKDQQKKATQLIQDRINKPITNYRGMYEPLTKPISSMTREELIKNLQKFRDSWEKITTRDTDLSDERLNDEPTHQLRNLIKFYYSTSAKLSAEDWLRKYVK